MGEVSGLRRDEDARLRTGLNHAWDWFSLHAGQRMQCVNFFLVASAFLVSAFGTAMSSKVYMVAIGVALLGSWVSWWFNRLDHRTKTLVKAGEAPMRVLQRRIAEATGVSELAILDLVEEPSVRWTSYSKFIDVLHSTTFCAFAVGAIYATIQWFASR